jgi:hypothetical protein
VRACVHACVRAHPWDITSNYGSLHRSRSGLSFYHRPGALLLTVRGGREGGWGGRGTEGRKGRREGGRGGRREERGGREGGGREGGREGVRGVR